MPEITLHRKVQFTDYIRSYSVEINGKKINKIKSGQKICFEVNEGCHVIQLKIDWASSNALEIEVGSKLPIHLECGSVSKGWRMFFTILYATIWRKNYLWIKECTALQQAEAPLNHPAGRGL